LNWEYKNEYLDSNRMKWLTYDTNNILEYAGWIQTYSNLTECIINNAGHLAPMNQPLRLLSMITSFINNEAFIIEE